MKLYENLIDTANEFEQNTGRKPKNCHITQAQFDELIQELKDNDKMDMCSGDMKHFYGMKLNIYKDGINGELNDG